VGVHWNASALAGAALVAGGVRVNPVSAAGRAPHDGSHALQMVLGAARVGGDPGQAADGTPHKSMLTASDLEFHAPNSAGARHRIGMRRAGSLWVPGASPKGEGGDMTSRAGMRLHRVFIVLLDISGYTRFITRNKNCLLHAEQVITELMESVIEQSECPLRLNKLEGDAALLYSLSDGTPAAARDILLQVRRSFDSFYARLAKLIESSNANVDIRNCIRELDLKAVLHHGVAAIKKVRHFMELAGEEVILAHRLLKNSIVKKEYVLMSDAFYSLLGGVPHETIEQRSEHCGGIGAVQVFVQYPKHDLALKPVSADQLRLGLNSLPHMMRAQTDALLRIFGLGKPEPRKQPV